MHHSRRSAIAFAALAGISAMPAIAAEPLQISLPSFSCHSGLYRAKLPSTLQALRNLGPLKSEVQGDAQDWEGYRTVEKWLRFDGLSVLVVTFSNDPSRYSLSIVDITSPRWQVSSRFRIGQSASKPLQELGVSSSQSNGEWRIAGESDALILVVREGRFAHVSYECYTG